MSINWKLQDRSEDTIRRLQKIRAGLWDMMADMPEKMENFYDNNQIFKPDLKQVERIWESSPVSFGPASKVSVDILDELESLVTDSETLNGLQVRVLSSIVEDLLNGF